MWSRINYGLGDLRGDLLGGISACSVTLPAAVGYGVLSGLGPAAGLYGMVAVGVFASLFAGTRGIIYGPNVLIALIMAVVVAEYASSPAEAATVGILAGLIQIVFGLLRLGRYAAYIPFALTSGFYSAFGILLILKQSVVALGGSPAHGGAIHSVRHLSSTVTNVNLDALSLTAICLGLAVLWRGRLLRLSPSIFVVLVAGVLAGVMWFQDAPIIGEISLGLPAIQLPPLSLGFFWRVLPPAFFMALLASVSTFVIALKLDTITGSQHRPVREMLGQGIGNIAAGFTEGVPGTLGAGTLVNVMTGGAVAGRRINRGQPGPVRHPIPSSSRRTYSPGRSGGDSHGQRLEDHRPTLHPPYSQSSSHLRFCDDPDLCSGAIRRLYRRLGDWAGRGQFGRGHAG